MVTKREFVQAAGAVAFASGMPARDIDDAAVLNLLPTWEPDAAVRKKILVDNPARLFGF